MRTTRARVATSVAGVIGMLAVAAVTVFFEMLALGLGTCGGDGGSPYAAADSPQGRVCDVLDRGGLTVVAGLELAALVAAGVVIGLWAWRRAGGRLAVASAIVAALLPLAGLFALSAPADQCSRPTRPPTARGSTRERADSPRRTATATEPPAGQA